MNTPKNTPRGLRNCNPGNIRQSSVRYLGEIQPSQDPAFKQFASMAWGYRALFALLAAYGKRGLRTICEMLHRYAPPVENHTDAYVRAVTAAAGIGADEPLDLCDGATMRAVAAAIARVENGRPADAAEVAAGWALYEQFRP